MQKTKLKILVADLERAIAELKSEIYSDTKAYRIDSDTPRSYLDTNDDAGELDYWLGNPQ